MSSKKGGQPPLEPPGAEPQRSLSVAGGRNPRSYRRWGAEPQRSLSVARGRNPLFVAGGRSPLQQVVDCLFGLFVSGGGAWVCGDDFLDLGCEIRSHTSMTCRFIRDFLTHIL